MSLDRLGAVAIEVGAAHAEVLEIDDVVLDPRVRLKCLIPTCYLAWGCSHCPPRGHSLTEVREMVAAHRWALFYRVAVSPTIIAAPGLSWSVQTGVMDDEGSLLNLGGHYILALTIGKLVQQEAEAQGLASHARFGAGSCKDTLCHFHSSCRELHGKPSCRHPDLSVASMEASGFDAFTMAARVGWEVFPIGGQCEPSSVKQGSLMGLVLLGPPGTERPESWPDRQGARATRKLPLHRRLGTSVAALTQANAALAQAPALFRELQVWRRVATNMARIEGSWSRGLTTMMSLFEGRPQRIRDPSRLPPR